MSGFFFWNHVSFSVMNNQVSIDQSVVDLDIPFRLGGFAATTIQLLGIVGVMAKVTWQVLLLFIPMAIACLWMQVTNTSIPLYYPQLDLSEKRLLAMNS